MKKILVLYRELAGYFVACLNHLCDEYDTEATLIAYPVHQDAPFQFRLSSRITLLQRNELSADEINKLCSDPSFDLIFSGGWADKDYLEGIKRKQSPALLGFDNQWRGTFKQRLSAIYGRVKIKPHFEYAFVPGSLQKTFALKLGFEEKNIITGAYSCDVPTFSEISRHREKNRGGKLRLIYTGRYAEEKFIRELWDCFKSLTETERSNWELHCAGTGPLWDTREESAGIFHHGFLQPQQLAELMYSGDAFVLPSTFEPWGVVVHEFAAAGFPMIVSSNVGAGEAFVHEGENGYIFQSGQKEDLKQKMIILFTKTEAERQRMGERSIQLAQQITPETWAKSLHKLM